MPAVAFSVTNLPFTEPMLSVWAQLVNLAGSKLEKHKIKKSPKQTFAGQSKVLLDGMALVLIGALWTMFIFNLFERHRARETYKQISPSLINTPNATTTGD